MAGVEPDEELRALFEEYEKELMAGVDDGKLAGHRQKDVFVSSETILRRKDYENCVLDVLPPKCMQLVQNGRVRPEFVAANMENFVALFYYHLKSPEHRPRALSYHMRRLRRRVERRRRREEARAGRTRSDSLAAATDSSFDSSRPSTDSGFDLSDVENAVAAGSQEQREDDDLGGEGDDDDCAPTTPRVVRDVNTGEMIPVGRRPGSDIAPAKVAKAHSSSSALSIHSASKKTTLRSSGGGDGKSQSARGIKSASAVRRVREERSNTMDADGDVRRRRSSSGGVSGAVATAAGGGASDSSDVTTSGVVKTGYMRKKGISNRRNWHRRYFVLKRGKLLYYESEAMKTLKGNVHLRGCVAEVGSQDMATSKTVNVFSVISMHRSFLAEASTRKQMLEWVDAINACVIGNFNDDIDDDDDDDDDDDMVDVGVDDDAARLAANDARLADELDSEPRIVEAGYLSKMGGLDGKVFQRRWFTLLSDGTLRWAKTDSAPERGSATLSRDDEIVGMESQNRIRIVVLKRTKSKKKEAGSTTKKSFTLRFTDKDTFFSWRSALTSLCEDGSRRKSGAASSAKAGDPRPPGLLAEGTSPAVLVEGDGRLVGDGAEEPPAVALPAFEMAAATAAAVAASSSSSHIKPTRTSALAMTFDEMIGKHPHLSVLFKSDINPSKRFKSRKLIGKGGFGEVYVAKDASDVKRGRVAIKKLTGRTEREWTHIAEEIRLLSLCDHPHIVGCIGGWVWRKRIWVAIEYCDGGNLQDLLLGRKLRESTIAIVGHQVALGISYLASRGIVHRDIKGMCFCK
jgi:Protein kinase domain/PH domain